MSLMNPNKHHVLLTAVFSCIILFSQQRVAQSYDSGQPLPVIHIVQRSESLSSIAAYYKMPADYLAYFNNISDASEVAVGDRLIIPGSPSPDALSSDTEAIVNAGDSLDVIAARLNLAAKDIALLNRIVNPNLLYVGQRLSVPGHSDSEPSPVSLIHDDPKTTLWKQALAQNINLFALATANDIANPADPGERLFVKMPDRAGRVAVLPLPWIQIDVNPVPLEVGRTGSLRVKVADKGVLSGKFNDHVLNFLQQDGNTFYAVFGIDRWAKPGLYPIELEFKSENGQAAILSRSVLVEKGGYAKEVIKLSEEETASRDNPQVVAAEQQYLTQKMGGFTQEKYWNGLFRIPAAGVLTSAFGTLRSINGSGYDSYHAGNDFAAPVGTPIYAPADGVVVDTGFLSIRGYSTILDHGMGVYSGYWHQASILVHPGDRVTAGQQIGTVGNTGSSTASHLHWEMWVGGVPIDSLQWLREEFP